MYAGSADHAVSESLYLTDPDGLGIEVYADRPRTTWQVNGGELHMTVEPLDLRGNLIREAAGGQAWTGAPAGTVIGHMHLYVGALDDATPLLPFSAGFRQNRVEFPRRAVPRRGRLPPPSRHEHLGRPGSPVATNEDARLLAWELVLPAAAVEKGPRRACQMPGIA